MKMGALERIAKERVRQQTQENYSLDHDDEHKGGQLALLAAAYALSSRPGEDEDEALLRLMRSVPYDWSFKPKDPIRDLERAGALIVAELERRLRAEISGGPG